VADHGFGRRNAPDFSAQRSTIAALAGPFLEIRLSVESARQKLELHPHVRSALPTSAAGRAGLDFVTPLQG
jgi:hypothetical protein